MNDDKDPEGLNDPALLAEIEAEFAELTREIERISAMPRSMAPEKSKLLQALKASWKSRFEAHGDRPEWRQRLDASIGHAVDRLLEEGLVENADGSLAFNLRGDILQSEGGPVLRGLVDGLVHVLEAKFPAAAPGKATTGAATSAPTEPIQALLGGLSQALAGALKGALQKVATSGAGSGGVDVKVAPAGAAQGAPSGAAQGAPSDAAQGAPSDAGPGAFTVSGTEAISASFEFDTRKQSAAGVAAGPNDGAPDAPPPQASAEGATAQPPPKAAAEAGAAANAFFQQLVQGFGQVVQQAVTKRPEAGDKTASGAAPPNPLGGLGALLSQVIQRAATSAPRPPAPPAAAPAEEQTAATEEQSAATAAPTQEQTAATAAPTQEQTATPAGSQAAAPSEEPSGPVVKIDFAGLLAQILSNKKP